MTTALKLRRGTTAQHASFTGAVGEVTVDTTKKTAVVHDGVTAGGVPLAKESDVTNKQPLDSELTTLAGMSASRASFLASAESFTFRNRIINGAMMIDQRNAGASVTNTTAGLYTADRWLIYGTVASKFTAQQISVSTIGFPKALGITSSSAYSVLSADTFFLQHRIEGFNVADLAWGTASAKAVTVSFVVNSSLTGTFGGSVINSAYTRSYPFTFSIAAANTDTTISVTIPGDTSGTWVTDNGIGMRLNFNLGSGATYSGTAGAWAGAEYYSATGATSVVGTSGATFRITGVQLEVGASATAFEYRQYGQELALCQRYYEQVNGSGSSVSLGSGTAFSSAAARVHVPFVTTKRSIPTISLSAAGTFLTQYGGGTNSPSAITSLGASTQSCYLFATGTYTSGHGVVLLDNGTSAYIGASSEL